MKNAELKKGLDLIIKGLSVISESLSDTDIMNPPVEEVKEEKPDNVVEITDDLDKMTLAQLKKRAKELGIEVVGTRKEIIEQIKNFNKEDVEEESVEEPTEEVEETEEEPTTDKFDEQAKAVAEEEDAEDIIEALKDVGIKATKKNYVEKLAEALRNELLSLDDDEEEEDSADEDDETEDVEVGEYNPAFDPEGFNDPKAMSKKRKSACDKLVKETLDKIENDKLSREDIESYLEDFLTDDEKDLLEDDSDDTIVSMYLEALKRTVDIEGDIHEMSDPYELEDETPMCCGHKLKFDAKSNEYICEICGTEYSNED